MTLMNLFIQVQLAMCDTWNLCDFRHHGHNKMHSHLGHIAACVIGLCQKTVFFFDYDISVDEVVLGLMSPHW